MPTYNVSLVRTFVVRIKAESSKDAKILSELYLDYSDCSEEIERKKYNFIIEKIEMFENDSFEVAPVEN